MVETAANNPSTPSTPTNPPKPSGPPSLPLSQTENGSLATAPLSTVVNSATNALYEDLYSLVHGEIKIVSVAANASGEGGSGGTGGTGGGGGAAGGGGNAPSSNEPENHAASVEEKLTAAALGIEKDDAAAAGAPGTAGGAAAAGGDDNANLETRKERMANLSFAQRRHELTHRMVRHTKALSHVYALTVASLPKSHAALTRQKEQQHHSHSHRHHKKEEILPPRLGATVQISSDALQFVRSGWVSQDEAQDALYFHHDGLWKARAHCHDVLGALCVLSTPVPNVAGVTDGSGGEMKIKQENLKEEANVKMEDGNEMMQVDNDDKEESTVKSLKSEGGGGRWPDFPTDVALAVDRYEISKEKSYSKSELQSRLACAVRRKLVLGEVGRFGVASNIQSSQNGQNSQHSQNGQNIVKQEIKEESMSGAVIGPVGGMATSNGNTIKEKDSGPLPWRVVLEEGGGSVRLTYGAPRTASTAEALRQRSLYSMDNTNGPDNITSNGANAANGENGHINGNETKKSTAESSTMANNLQKYPMEARLSILSEAATPSWKLLSLHVRFSPKTGESDHQLGLNRKQMFDLHRIGERAMIVEEAICRKVNGEIEERKKSKKKETKKEEDENKTSNGDGGETNEVKKEEEGEAMEIDTDRKITIQTGDGPAASSAPTVSTEPVVPRPLLRLFEVTHAFALSLQLEMLSAQAEALRRGAWGGAVTVAVGGAEGGVARPGERAGAGAINKDTLGDGIAVSPAYFFEKSGAGGGGTGGSEEGTKADPIAVMAVHFWSCDDRYGSPKVSDLSNVNIQMQPSSKPDTNPDANDPHNTHSMMEDAGSVSTTKSRIAKGQRMDDNYLPPSDRKGDKRLSLCIRAVPTVGLVVSLSGGSEIGSSISSDGGGGSKDNNETIVAQNHHLKRNVDKLLSSIQDPFQLSMSDALLAATVLCAERRCQAVVAALNRQKTNRIPSWIHLEVECGSITVAACISYPSSPSGVSTTSTDEKDDSSNSPKPSRLPTVLFRLACDSRTGRYIPVFPRPANLLRLLSCNDPSASDIQALRNAAMASASSALHARPTSGFKGTKGGTIEAASRESTGRIVRDAFDALSRSMDTLGRRCGVGGDWNDVDGQSMSLREKSMEQACRDLRVSLIACSGLAAVFGVAAIALKIVGGVNPVADMAGGPIEDKNNEGIVRVPPLSVPLHQRIAEKVVKEGNDEWKRISQLETELFAVTAKASNDSLDLVCYDVLTTVQSASAVPARIKLAEANPPETTINFANNQQEIADVRPSKRPRTTNTLGESMRCHHTLEEVEFATQWFDSILNQ